MRFRRLAVVVAVAAAAVAATTPAGAADDAPCADVSIVFARGSGQSLDFREAPAFFEKVGDRLDGVSLNLYELGTESHDGAQYPAHGIGFDSLQSFKNLVEADASWTGPAGGQYRASVTAGVTELTSYLEGRAARCPDELFVVGGYSQGAQVVGDTLAGIGAGVREQVAHVSLFGDPKLYLPEGRGPFPPACRGKEFSPWRRGNVSCFTDNGILEARKPYLPADLEDRAGSWCDRNDPICNNNSADFLWSAHGDYASDGAEMDEAAREAAAAVADRLPPEQAAGIDVSVLVLAAGADGIDVAFVIDTTGSMYSSISAARAVADGVGTAIVDIGGRVALTEYRDAFDTFVAEVRVPLTTDVEAFRDALSLLVPGGGGDIPEALLSALMTTFDGLDWRPGATKAAVVLTDADYHDPDVANGWTLTDVVTRSLEIDPVNVYPVVPWWRVADYEELADRTAGQVIPDTGDTAAALQAAFTAVTSRPVVFFPFDGYVAAPGDAVDLEVAAYDIDSTITSFQWDFDADGTIDATTTEPRITHTYAEPFDGLVEVRAHSADGGIGSATATVAVSTTGLASLEPGTPTGLVAEAPAPGTVELSWDAPPAAPAVDGWFVTGPGGDLLARVPAGTTTITLDGVDEGAEIAVSAFNAYGTSDPATVVVGDAGGGGPREGLERLRADVRAAAIPDGFRRSLEAKLEAAIASVGRSSTRSACGQIAAFVRELGSSAAEQHLSAATRADWRDRADRVSSQLDC